MVGMRTVAAFVLGVTFAALPISFEIVIQTPEPIALADARSAPANPLTKLSR